MNAPENVIDAIAERATICPHCGRDNTGYENQPCSDDCPQYESVIEQPFNAQANHFRSVGGNDEDDLCYEDYGVARDEYGQWEYVL